MNQQNKQMVLELLKGWKDTRGALLYFDLLTSDSPSKVKFETLINKGIGEEKYCLLALTQSRDEGLIPMLDNVIAATIVALPGDASLFLRMIERRIAEKGTMSDFSIVPHAVLMGTLRGITMLDRWNLSIHFEDKILPDLFWSMVWQKLPVLSGLPLVNEQRDLLNNFMEIHQRGLLLQSIAKRLRELERATWVSPGTFQFIKNFNYAYFGRARDEFARLNMIIGDSNPNLLSPK